ncbi:MAG: glycosyltransferase family 2 protein [Phycisphaerales bacterium]
MSAVSHQIKPDEVTNAAAAPMRGVDRTRLVASPPTARVRVLIVTWNRRAYVSSLLNSLSRQTYPLGLMDVTVIDNASTDGTLDSLRETFRPETVVQNRTESAHEPAFTPDTSDGGPNTLGFGSLTLVRNSTNVGGCGGFNTGLAYTEAADRPEAPTDLVWLVDDDADVAPDTLEQLHRAMSSSDDIGLVGSRTVNIADRRTTIETTIYYNTDTGAMQDDCPPQSPKRRAWLDWVNASGGTRGDRTYTGQIDVDVVSACSMLARWGAVVGKADPTKPAVGFWDWRYFIYCDDADWCLRFGRAGWRVVLALDAVVYHTPWNLKLTPARIYYANRNKVWMGQKVLSGRQLRSVTTRAMKSILRDSLHAAWKRRLFHAHIILDTARDIAIQRTGKTGSDGPPGEPVFDALRRLGLLRADASIAALCPHADAVKWSDDLREHLRTALLALPEAQREGLALPEIRVIVRNTVNGPLPPGAIVYGGRRASKLKKQLHIRKARPSAVVVFDQTNDLPALSIGGHNLHIDQKKPTVAQVERDGWIARTRFMIRWAPIAIRCLYFAATVKPYRSATRYG